jgi:hypothetical protein
MALDIPDNVCAMRTRSLALTLAALAATAACGDAGSAVPDAHITCWPVDTASPGGSVTLGSGTPDNFLPMPDELQLQYGGQDGYDLVVMVKQSGYGTGDPVNILNATNPRTRVHAYFDDTNVPLIMGTCPYRLAYQDVGDGEYVSLDVVPVIFDMCWRSGNLIGKQIRIEAELLAWNGTMHAIDSHVVTATAPPPGYPDEPDAPGCM